MDTYNISNSPVIFKLSGKDYQVKRLSLLDLFGEFEVLVVNRYMDNIAKMADRIKDTKERIEFQRSALKHDVPKNEELRDEVNKYMDSMEGGIKILNSALSKLNNVTQEEIKEIISNPANTAVITNLMGYVVGADVEKKEEVLPAGATVIETEKKT